MSKVRWFASDPEQQAVAQVNNTALMPFVKGIAVMPDVHLGKGSTVGTVVATKGAIMPACVGVDIGCGMIAVRTSLDPARVREKAATIREGIERRIPVGVGLRGMNTRLTNMAPERVADLEAHALIEWGDPNHMNARAGDWRLQLGSLGGGNHFIEVCVGRTCDILGYHDSPEEVWIILHSGSRGVGNKTGNHWTKVAQKQAKKFMYDQWLPDPDLAYLVEHSEEFWEYMKELRWCQEYARLNREEMMDRVVQEMLFTVHGLMNDQPIVLERINCHHNYVAKENHGGENLWITRKGAIEASKGTRGLIPGSMGARSYIVTGQGFAGAYSSAPHGAGRAMSRTAARKRFDLHALTELMQGLGIEANVRDAILDEHPGAYKNIDIVMHEARELVTPTHVLSQIISVKGD